MRQFLTSRRIIQSSQIYLSRSISNQSKKELNKVSKGTSEHLIAPKAATFQEKPKKIKREFPKSNQDENQNLTKLKQDAPMHLKKQAMEMYERCRLSNKDSITKFAIVRQMRNLDLPPHGQLWQEINSSDELNLYRWINEAFGQLLYSKKLWKPSVDWTKEDDKSELSMRDENYKLLQSAYQEQIVDPLKDKFGDDQVTIALSNLREDEQLYIKPAIIWRSFDKEQGETWLEWMSEVTADVIWPGLVSCGPEDDIARAYWESEAAHFSQSVGGISCGMGPNGEKSSINHQLHLDPSSHADHPYHLHPSFNVDSVQHQRIAEAVLTKKFLQQRYS